MYQIKINTKKEILYYAGEGDGYYKASNQYQLMGAYNAWKGELGVRGNAPSGVSVYDFSNEQGKAYNVSGREIVSGIMDRQRYSFLPKGSIEIIEV